MHCTVEVADTALQQGQGMHGSFGRGDTWNFMAIQGPDFKAQFVDPAPASNADIGRTIAELMHPETSDKGKLVGRVLTETMPGGKIPEVSSRVVTSGCQRAFHRAQHAAGRRHAIFRCRRLPGSDGRPIDNSAGGDDDAIAARLR